MSSPSLRIRSLLAVAVAGSCLATATTTTHSAHSPASASAAGPMQATHTDTVRAVGTKTIAVGVAKEQVEVGQSIAFRGVVNTRRALRPRGVRNGVEALNNRDSRTVLLEDWGFGGWVRVARTESTRKGTFAFTLPAGAAPATRKFRVVAPRVSARHGWKASKYLVGAPVSVKVALRPAVTTIEVPTGNWDPAEYPDPTTYRAGDASDWGWMLEGGGRWNPCQVINWAYNPASSYAGSQADVKRAFAKIAGVTGLRFKYVGETAFLPATSTDPTPEGVDIVVGWAQLGQRTAGMAKVSGNDVGVRDTGADVRFRITQALISLDQDMALPGGFARSGGPTWGQVMLHEILHGVGLDHANGTEQMMYPYTDSSNHEFGAGDMTGMVAVGANKTCLGFTTPQ